MSKKTKKLIINLSVFFVPVLITIIAISLYSGRKQTTINLSESSDQKTDLVCNKYDFKYHEDKEGNTSFDVLCDNRVIVFSAGRYHLADFWLINFDGKAFKVDKDTRITPRDINSDHIPDLIVGEYSGGASCCYSYKVLSLGRKFHEISAVDWALEDAEFVDINKDGKLEIITRDYTLSRDEGGWTGYPSPRVVLEYKNGKYEFSPTLMKNLSLRNSANIEKDKRDIESNRDIPQGVKNYIVTLIYYGRGEKAWKYLDEICPGVLSEEKQLFENELLLSLMSSPHWEGILKANGWTYEQPDGEMACPEFAGRDWLIKTK